MSASSEVPRFHRMGGRRHPSLFPATLAAFALVLTACEAPPPTAVTPDMAPELAIQEAGDFIPGRFIVTVRAGVNPASVAQGHGVTPDFVYAHALTGFAGEISDAARSGLMRDARVVRIEQDRVVRATGTQVFPDNFHVWGLDRIDQRGPELDNTYYYNQTGSGVTVYILDTGIHWNHVEFTGRLIDGYDAIDIGGNAGDCHGHGTHVAGTVGGTTVGVAKGVFISPVRVLDCTASGTTSGIIAGIDWVTYNHVPPAVANMSLGGGTNDSMDDAVRNSIAAGITYTVSAGNTGEQKRPALREACSRSPARVREALTVGATDWNDAKASFSSIGECVDLFAPGVGILSATKDSNDAYRTMNGTSMAAPHVAGVAALYLELNRTAAPGTVFDAIYEATTKGIVTNSSTANNHLLFSLAWAGGTPPVQYTITATADPGGTIEPSGNVQVNEGASQTFNITANEGYQIGDVLVDDLSVGAVASYTFVNVTAAHTIHASFASVPTHTITASAGLGGTIEPSGNVQVSEGASQTFTITANEGYQIGNVLVDDTSVGAVASYTFVNVTAAHTIHATFEEAASAPLSIDQFDLTKTSNPQFARVRVNWTVSGDTLSQVRVDIQGAVNSDSQTWSVSGSTASGEHEFSFRGGFGTYTVTLTVTDANGSSISQTKEITL